MSNEISGLGDFPPVDQCPRPIKGKYNLCTRSGETFFFCDTASGYKGSSKHVCDTYRPVHDCRAAWSDSGARPLIKSCRYATEDPAPEPNDGGDDNGGDDGNGGNDDGGDNGGGGDVIPAGFSGGGLDVSCIVLVIVFGLFMILAMLVVFGVIAKKQRRLR